MTEVCFLLPVVRWWHQNPWSWREKPKESNFLWNLLCWCRNPCCWKMGTDGVLSSQPSCSQLWLVCLDKWVCVCGCDIISVINTILNHPFPLLTLPVAESWRKRPTSLDLWTPRTPTLCQVSDPWRPTQAGLGMRRGHKRGLQVDAALCSLGCFDIGDFVTVMCNQCANMFTARIMVIECALVWFDLFFF